MIRTVIAIPFSLSLFLSSQTLAQAEALDILTSPGAELFNSSCSHCHGGNGQGGQLGPSLLSRVAEEDDNSLSAFLKTGVPERGMPPALVSDRQMPELLSYLRFLSANVADDSFTPENGGNQYASIPAINAETFIPVTSEVLNNPAPEDWLMFSRTYDAQRFSPLDQINQSTVNDLSLAWSRSLPDGLTETIPTVYKGVMYLSLPGGSVAALDGRTGDVIWNYEREYEGNAGGIARSKTLAIYEDLIFFTAPDEVLVALDAITGKVRWETPVTGRGNTSGAIVVEGKVISGGTCFSSRENCFISAHDALTGELKWKFMTAKAPDEDTGFDTWAGLPLDERLAGTWGLPGSYDVENGILYWSVANPNPTARVDRHGDASVVSDAAPSELYSNSTLAIDPDSGELLWYYQHLPGDDWDEDMNQERIIFRTPINPDPEQVRWINPNINAGEEREVVVNVGEGGGLWVLDKVTGEFLWATPFPEDVDNFVLSDIDVTTGRTFTNRDLVLDEPGKHRLVCFFNTRSFWPGAYNPGNNSLYVPYIRNCLNMTAAAPATETTPAMPQSRIGAPQPGYPVEELNGMAKVNMETGEITHWVSGPVPTNSAVLATQGNLIFWGDINRRFRAMDADNGEVLWETILGAPISNGNITYAVDGRQYVAVLTGDNLSATGLNTGTMGPVRLNLRNGAGNNSIYVFALPEK